MARKPARKAKTAKAKKKTARRSRRPTGGAQTRGKAQEQKGIRPNQAFHRCKGQKP